MNNEFSVISALHIISAMFPEYFVLFAHDTAILSRYKDMYNLIGN